MLVWYVATAAAAVWAVFDSPGLDYRFVMVGAVLPVTEVALGRPGPLHSLVTAVAVLAVVMLATQGRRLVRRRLLGIPIGLMAYLVFSGTWADTDAFWWPLTGFALSEADPPELARGGVTVLLELAGVALLVWWVRRVGPADRVVCSPLERTRATAEAWGVPVQVDHRWVELDYGSFDGTPLHEVPPEVWTRWRHDLDYAPPGGESLRALGARVRSACDDLAADARDRHVVVVTHVSPIKAAAAWAMGVGDDAAWRMFVSPASITRIAVTDRGPSLHGFNVTTHLDGLHEGT